MLNLNSIMISSADYKKLANYYSEVFQKKADMEDENSKVSGYLVGNSFLSIAAHDKVTGPNQNPERSMVFFETTDVAGEFERIKNIEGTTVVKEPYSPGGNEKFSIATLADPDGNYFQLASPWNT